MMRSFRLVVGASVVAGCLVWAVPFQTGAQPADKPAQPTAQPNQPGGRPQGPPGRGEARAEGPTNAEGAMKLINRSIKRLSRQVEDASKKDENLRLVLDAERGCVLARGFVPRGPWSEDPDAAKKAKVLDSYRMRLVALARKLLDVEVAILDGKGDSAKTLLGEIAKMKDDAHKEMGVKEDE